MKSIKIVKTFFRKISDKWFYGLCLLSVSISSFADDSVIPISTDDQTASGSDFSTTAMSILKKDILPFLEIGGAAILLFTTLNGLWKGYKEYQKEKDMDPLKQAVIASVIAIVVGGAILYLLDMLRNKSF